jgi:Fe-S cluster assembly protein SufB
MVEKKASNSESVLKDIVESPYKYGFKTDIETEQFPKGVNTEIIGQISDRKKEPNFLRQFRQKAFTIWEKNRPTRLELFKYCQNRLSRNSILFAAKN